MRAQTETSSKAQPNPNTTRGDGSLLYTYSNNPTPQELLDTGSQRVQWILWSNHISTIILTVNVGISEREEMNLSAMKSGFVSGGINKQPVFEKRAECSTMSKRQ